MELIEQTVNGVPFWSADGITQAGGAAHGFSTRAGGVSGGTWLSLNLGISRGDDPEHVRENYRRFFAAIGARGGVMASCEQVHGSAVHNVTSADWKDDPYGRAAAGADGLITAIPGVVLTVFTADCIPVLLYDPKRRVAAALHAGWRGTASGIAAAAVELMGGVYGCEPADILAAVGPGIGQCCFETHEDVPNAMTAALAGESLPYLRLKENGKFAVDLKGINVRRLELAGLDPAHIAVCPDCTCCMADKYWSHRRQGTRRGSMAAAIELL